MQVNNNVSFGSRMPVKVFVENLQVTGGKIISNERLLDSSTMSQSDIMANAVKNFIELLNKPKNIFNKTLRNIDDEFNQNPFARSGRRGYDKTIFTARDAQRIKYADEYLDIKRNCNIAQNIIKIYQETETKGKNSNISLIEQKIKEYLKDKELTKIVKAEEIMEIIKSNYNLGEKIQNYLTNQGIKIGILLKINEDRNIPSDKIEAYLIKLLRKEGIKNSIDNVKEIVDLMQNKSNFQADTRLAELSGVTDFNYRNGIRRGIVLKMLEDDSIPTSYDVELHLKTLLQTTAKNGSTINHNPYIAKVVFVGQNGQKMTVTNNNLSEETKRLIKKQDAKLQEMAEQSKPKDTGYLPGLSPGEFTPTPNYYQMEDQIPKRRSRRRS